MTRSLLPVSARGVVFGVGTVSATIALGVLLQAPRESQEEPVVETGVPTEISPQELVALAGSAGHVVYWAGPASPGFKLELTRDGDGRLFLRYLPDSAPLGDREGAYTTVATYPVEDAFDVARRAARRRGMTSDRVPGGGIAVSNRRRPTGIYLAYPGSDYLVEVFAPAPGAARKLVLSQNVAPVR